jgi:hypothetical protein
MVMKIDPLMDGLKKNYGYYRELPLCGHCGDTLGNETP